MAESTGLAPEFRRALDRLSRLPELRGYYLAGGTAVSMHLGHRQSLDLDFFSLDSKQDLDRTRTAVVSAFDRAQVLRETDAALHLLCDGTPVDFVRYPYAPLEPPAPSVDGILVAGLLDLAAMKLAAIARRGIRRDFWDLHVIVQNGLSLERACEAYVRRFGVAEADLYHVLRSLTYFEDAERDPILPRGMHAADWLAIKNFFQEQAPTVLRG
jgi:hypothetical protein